MNAYKNKSKFYKCECSAHLLEVTRDEYEGQVNVDVSIWALGHAGNVPFTWRERLRWCWNILRTGNPWGDSVTLSLTNAEKLAKYLTEVSTDKPAKILLTDSVK